MRFRAELDQLDAMLKTVLQGAAAAGLKGEDRHRVELASEEVLVNIIEHAYSGVDAGDVEIEWSVLDGGGLQLTFRDCGIPFNPLLAATPDIGAQVERRPVGGLGIYLVRQLMDRVEYERRGSENVLILALNHRHSCTS